MLMHLHRHLFLQPSCVSLPLSINNFFIKIIALLAAMWTFFLLTLQPGAAKVSNSNEI
jgi:hypothetical protein